MRPRIGITSNFAMNTEDPPRPQSYLLAGFTDGVFLAGGLGMPVPVPPAHDDALLDELLAQYDGLIFTGGYDLDPQLYGEAPHARTTPLHPRRCQFEMDLFRRADQARVPMFGICLGHQVAHVARGGRLIQHVDELELTPAICHHTTNEENAWHDVAISPDSRLSGVVGVSQLEVSSRHHQIVDQQHPGLGLKTVATAADGVIEASEDCDGRFLLTVQWHPEDLLDRPPHLNLFAALVEAAGQQQK